jgi:hypothetical protein
MIRDNRVTEFNYMSEAGLYAGKKLKGSSRPRYKRFETAAEAVRFAIEDLPGSQLRGSILEIDEARFNERQIRMLYDAPGFPLLRRTR